MNMENGRDFWLSLGIEEVFGVVFGSFYSSNFDNLKKDKLFEKYLHLFLMEDHQKQWNGSQSYEWFTK